MASDGREIEDLVRAGVSDAVLQVTWLEELGNSKYTRLEIDRESLERALREDYAA